MRFLLVAALAALPLAGCMQGWEDLAGPPPSVEDCPVPGGNFTNDSRVGSDPETCPPLDPINGTTNGTSTNSTDANATAGDGTEPSATYTGP